MYEWLNKEHSLFHELQLGALCIEDGLEDYFSIKCFARIFGSDLPSSEDTFVEYHKEVQI